MGFKTAKWLPEKVLTISSERMDLACPRRFLFRHTEHAQNESFSKPGAKSMGLAWDEVLQDVHLWWQATETPYVPWYAVRCPWCSHIDPPRGVQKRFEGEGSCSVCGGSALGVLSRASQRWLEHDPGEVYVRLYELLRVWLQVQCWRPQPGWRVVAVQLPLAIPVFPTGAKRPYRPKLFTVSRPDGTWRLARRGEASVQHPEGWTLREESVPVWASLRIDALLYSEDEDALVFEDWKLSSNPARFLDDIAFDRQMPLYKLALTYAIEKDLLWELHPKISRKTRIIGWRHNVTSSADLHAPIELKPKKDGSFGGFSLTVRNLAQVSKPLFEDAMAAHGLDIRSPSQGPWGWKEILESLEYADQARVLTRTGNASAAQLDAVQEEIYGIALRTVELQHKAQRLTGLDELNAFFPRIPICRIPGGSCAYKKPCMDASLDSKDPELLLLRALYKDKGPQDDQ